MEDEFDVPQDFKPLADEVLDPGKIDISQEVASQLPLQAVLSRVHHHFRHTDFRYQYVSRDTLHLRVRSRKYPLFGAFVGNVHVYEKLSARPQQYKDYALEGLLEYRVSFLWFIAVLSFFFLLVYLIKPGFWFGAAIEVLGTALVIFSTHRLGRDERDEVEERVEASFLLLRSTLQNIR